ncbi:MAG: YneF family protein [Solobacterium sp.]|nr:YneF family protein [Solobacterium sp.]
MSAFWSSLLWFILGGVVGAIISFYFTKKNFEKQLKENPPVNEKMIRAMFMQMGRKPSEAQIKAVMRSMNQQK